MLCTKCVFYSSHHVCNFYLYHSWRNPSLKPWFSPLSHPLFFESVWRQWSKWGRKDNSWLNYHFVVLAKRLVVMSKHNNSRLFFFSFSANIWKQVFVLFSAPPLELWFNSIHYIHIVFFNSLLRIVLVLDMKYHYFGSKTLLTLADIYIDRCIKYQFLELI